VRGASKTLLAALVMFLLAVGFAACGGGDSSNSTSAESEGTAQAPNADERKSGSGAEGKSESAAGEGKSSGSSASDERAEADSFVPKQHSDSGGGSAQFKVKGGDNSIQEFGAEGGSAEFAAASAALHNFLDARAEGNWPAACEYMSQGIAKSFEQLASQAKRVKATTCAEILQVLTNPAAGPALKAEAEKVDVGSLRTEGERSFVIYTGLEGTTFAMPMANEDGAWKVASLAGTPLN
jgi:hypothetical protein